MDTSIIAMIHMQYLVAVLDMCLRVIWNAPGPSHVPQTRADGTRMSVIASHCNFSCKISNYKFICRGNVVLNFWESHYFYAVKKFKFWRTSRLNWSFCPRIWCGFYCSVRNRLHWRGNKNLWNEQKSTFRAEWCKSVIKSLLFYPFPWASLSKNEYLLPFLVTQQ